MMDHQHKRDSTQQSSYETAFSQILNPITFLEHCFHTSITIKVIQEEETHLDFALDNTTFRKGDLVLDQRLLFQHGETGANLLFAASLLRLDLLSPAHRPDQQTHQPLSTLLQPLCTDTTVIDCERYPVGSQEEAYFALPPQSPCLARTILYTVTVPLLLVHEVFPLPITG